MRRTIFFLCILLMTMLSGCEKSEGTDIISFCNVYNELSQNFKISDDRLIKESGNGDYIIYVGEGKRETLIRIKCDENNAVSSCSVTGEDRDAVIEISDSAVRAIGREVPSKLLNEAKISNQSVIQEVGSQRYAWFAGDGYFTFSVHKLIQQE